MALPPHVHMLFAEQRHQNTLFTCFQLFKPPRKTKRQTRNGLERQKTDCGADLREHTECWWGMALAEGTPYRPLRCEE